VSVGEAPRPPRSGLEQVDRVLNRGIFARPSPVGDPLLSRGTFARRSRLSMKALRLYERAGLLTPARVDPDNGYRWYAESQLAMARLVGMLRRLDMPLAQVANVVTAPGPVGAELIASYWEEVERRVVSQRELGTYLRRRLLGDEGGSAGFEVREREVAEQLVITEQRHVLVDELPGWLSATMRRLAATARGFGGMTGAPFVVFHGEVNQDSDGPVEVCVPTARRPEARAGASIRREPAHREAYLRLQKARVQYPQILSAYDALVEWIGSNGAQVTASPREVYFTDWDRAGPADQVCDVAFPIA
jgi:DNA-binding transcriptional MerR regulator